MPEPGSAAVVTPGSLVAQYAELRARSRALFDLLTEEAYYARPISLRNPIVFYEGHLPAFAINTLSKRAGGASGAGGAGGAGGGAVIDEHLETIFARGIDPETEAAATARGNPSWPSRAVVTAFAAEAERRVVDLLSSVDNGSAGAALQMAAWTVLEHEAMHHETMVYMWHQLPYAMKRAGTGARPYTTVEEDAVGAGLRACPDEGPRACPDRIQIPAGMATLGTSLAEEPFAWDNELPPHRVRVEAFTVDAHNVTNARFLEFVEAGGYRDPRWWRPEDWAWVQSDQVWHPPFWEAAADPSTNHQPPTTGEPWVYRGMFERIPLPASWPVYVTWAEAQAYARWSGGRLLAEPEFHRAAFGTPDGLERRYPWGDDEPAARHGNFDFDRGDPVPAGSRPAGASAFGVHDMMGNGWEWTATVFAGFDGFTPLPTYPEYSADFFDGQHFVMKGGSPATARLLLRRGFRNWFRPQYPYVYATFRCAR